MVINVLNPIRCIFNFVSNIRVKNVKNLFEFHKIFVDSNIHFMQLKKLTKCLNENS